MKREAKSYSIIDHELLHGGYLSRLTHQALALYLFLVVVGDSTGKSFYALSSIGTILRMDSSELRRAQEVLITEGLIEYQKPYWRVMTLTQSKRSAGESGVTALNPLVGQILTKWKEAKHA